MSEGKPAGPSPEVRALLDHAVAAHRAGDLDEAARRYQAVLEIAPDEPNALTNLGTVALQQGRLEDGVALIERSLAIRPDQSNAINNRGNALLSLKRMDEALAAFDRALELDPNNAEAQANRGVALSDLGRAEEAVGAYEAALALRPEFLDALNGLGIALEALGRSEQALGVYDRSLAVAPQSWELHYNRGNALRRLNRPEEAAQAYSQALAIHPTAGAYANRGVALQAIGRFDEAMADWAQALALEPGHADARWNRALQLLLRGDFAEGWAEYEWRWSQPSFRDSPVPPGAKWLGETPIAGKRLLIVTEQGFGDTLQMMRYATLAAEAGATVTLSVDPALAELAASVPGVGEVVSAIVPGSYDLWVPMMSLPLAFRTTPETVPATVPYVAAPAARRDAWAKRLGAPTRPRVGLVWSGRATHGNDANRSIPLAMLEPLLAADAEFISVQAEYREADRARLAELPIRDLSGELKSFGDTAAVIAALDMVVSVDTSVAHLVGALAKPLRVMLPVVPDFRWGLRSEITPWYPTARLLRQATRGDWAPVIAAALADIRALAG